MSADQAAVASSRSAWSGRAGLVGSDDVTLWCKPSIEGNHVRSQLRRVALDGTQANEVSAPDVAQRVRFRCFADAALTGAASTVTSPWSLDQDGDLIDASCPSERPFPGLALCQLGTSDKPPFVYAGPSCGAGVAGLAAKPALRGQLIGDHYELEPGKPLFNNTGKAGVGGTDLGFQFLAQGRMYIGFGDTWENDLSFPGLLGYRGSILAYTHDFDPSDANGIAIEGWESTPERPGIAKEVIASPHDQSGNGEFTAIAAAGFGLSEGAAQFRFLWFAAIQKWDPFTTKESTLAWSRNGGTFTRGDQAPYQHPARWPFESYFGPGAVWVDREEGYLYFFGVRTYQQGSPIRLARVRASAASVLDHLQYEYWTGRDWQRPDPADEYALASLRDPAADLLPGSSSQSSRPEFSVAYNPYVGRFVMIVHNDVDAFQNAPETRLQIWQAERVEGPWTLADTGTQLVLPPNLYGPYMSEQTFSAGGRDIAFTLSDWNVLPLVFGQPYVVGLWNLQLERKLQPGCEP